MAMSDQALIEKLKLLPAEKRAEVEDFVEFTIAPALEAAGVPAMIEEEIDAEIRAVRAERRARNQGK
jgi:hypothetical protein